MASKLCIVTDTIHTPGRSMLYPTLTLLIMYVYAVITVHLKDPSFDEKDLSAINIY